MINYIYARPGAPARRLRLLECIRVVAASVLPSIAANRGGAAKFGLQISPTMNWVSGQQAAPSQLAKSTSTCFRWYRPSTRNGTSVAKASQQRPLPGSLAQSDFMVDPWVIGSGRESLTPGWVFGGRWGYTVHQNKINVKYLRDLH